MSDGNKVYSIVTDKIIALLEAGTVPWRMAWRPRGGSVARNAWGKPYRGINVFLLALERIVHGYKSNTWMTFKQVTERGGSVKEGEKSTLVVYSKPLKVDEKDRDGNLTGKKKTIFILRYFLVFNLDQTTGVKLTKKQQAELAPVEEVETISVLDDAEAILATYFGRDDAPTLTEGGMAWYRPSTDLVNIPERSQYDAGDEGEYYSTAFHEIIHSTGHPSRLNRKGEGEAFHELADGAREKRALEELVAELGCSFLCSEAGIDNSTIDNSAAYIQNWLQVFKNDKTMVVKAAAMGQKAAEFVLPEVQDEDEGEDE